MVSGEMLNWHDIAYKPSSLCTAGLPRGATDIDCKVNGALGVVQSTDPSLVLPGCPITSHITDEILSWRKTC